MLSNTGDKQTKQLKIMRPKSFKLVIPIEYQLMPFYMSKNIHLFSYHSE